MIAFLFRIAARMPLGLLHIAGAGMGWITYWASPSYRHRLAHNAAQAGVSVADSRAAVAHTGRMVAELPWLWLRPADRTLGERVRWTGVEHLEAALSSGRGVLMMTPHLGAFEVIAQSYAERFGDRTPMTALYRPARQPWLRDLVAQSRNRPGLHTVPAQLSGVREMIRALRRGQVVGLLPDQVPPQGQGVWAPFFGQPAYTMTLVGRLLHQTHAVPVPVWCERLPGHARFIVHVEAWTEPLPQGDDAQAWAGMLNRAMEQLIRQCPQQYLWGYHRYKQPRDPAVAAPVQGTRT